MVLIPCFFKKKAKIKKIINKPEEKFTLIASYGHESMSKSVKPKEHLVSHMGIPCTPQGYCERIRYQILGQFEQSTKQILKNFKTKTFWQISN